MNTRNCSVDFETHSLVVTRSFLKKASAPFSEEYKMLVRLTKLHPDFTIKTKAATPRMQQFMPTYEKMMWYIRTQEKADELMETFSKVRDFSVIQKNPYMYVRRWFLTQFPELDTAA